MGMSRASFFADKVKNHDGVAEIFKSKTAALINVSSHTHIIIDPKFNTECLPTLLGMHADDIAELNCKFVNCKWISACLDTKTRIDEDAYIIIPCSRKRSQPGSTSSDAMLEESPKRSRNQAAKQQQHTLTASPDKTTPERAGCSSVTRTDTTAAAESGDTDNTEQIPPQLVGKEHFLCMKSSKAESDCSSGVHDNGKVSQLQPAIPAINQLIIEKLQEMASAYKSSNDSWRAYSYEKAIISIKSVSEPIDTYDKARSLRNVGSSLADKIHEIASSGRLEKLEKLTASDHMKAVQLFSKIWGVGSHTANLWASQGMRTLDDVKEKAKLTSSQKIGMTYFAEFEERMLRGEVAEIEAQVRRTVRSIDDNLIMEVCGSYRRGKPTCGDIDILITHPDGHNHRNVLNVLISKLHDNGLLTDDLTHSTNSSSHGDMAKYMGVCQLQQSSTLAPPYKHRRIDIIVTPYTQYGTALLYFTGSAYFNRSMRLMADKMGMSLTEHALYKDVIRQNGEIIHHGCIVNTPHEKDVFNYLGVPYRPPEERDHE